ncbi:lipoamide acyltransferase component of branched-chain alpha-keto acid dehydrogenase complex, mitochondrial isoform X2 [Euwallacea similis]|uniref:lipoamide acyltransferase component of branched-chain alpha-keto acid dehydrogenase complex, mitochondrial isoform X2 n=1 Tax=Euwallacea similis TaxID=1736056 RepID=UPI00344C6C6B
MSHVSSFASKVLNAPYKALFQKRKVKQIAIRNIFASCILNKNISFLLSDIGEGIREVVVKEWFVSVGDKVSQFDNICEVQSDKASVTITSRYDGVITKLHYQIDDTALVGQPLIDVETDEIDGEVTSIREETAVREPTTVTKKQSISTPEIPETSSTVETGDSSEQTVLCIPSVRRIAKEFKIDLTKVKGTGKQGRILKEDIMKYVDARPLDCPEPLTPPVFFSDNENYSTEPIKGFTKAMFTTMSEALKIPHFVYSDEIKVTKLATLRRELANVPELDIKITFLPFFIKAISNALQRYPIINSSLDQANNNIIYWKQHNIGVAMATSKGLAVPVVKNVEKLTVLEITADLQRLMKNGKNGTFAPDDLARATFSISNIGVVGGTYTKPVILPPQVAIVAIGRTQVLPRYDDGGDIIKEQVINISASADHRIIDGVTMASFINVLKKQIENPYLLFLNL